MGKLMTKHVKVVKWNKNNGEETFSKKGQVNSLKKKYMTIIDEKMMEEGQSLTKAQRDILGLLVYNTCVTGVQSISLDRLVEKSGYSRATVARAKKAIEELGIFAVGYLGDEYKGHYVFVLAVHNNYSKIMVELFNFEVNDNSCDNTNDNSSNSENPCGSKAEEGKTVPTLYTFNAFKQENNTKQASERIESEDPQENGRANRFMSENQRKFFHTIKSGDYHELIMDKASVIALRVEEEFKLTTALKAVIKLDTALKSYADESVKSVPALFEYYYNQVKQQVPRVSEKPKYEPNPNAIFYNWLEEDPGEKSAPNKPKYRRDELVTSPELPF